MEPIHSGTTLERKVRNTLLTAVLCVYSAWSFWDGYMAYPRANVQALFREQLGIEVPDPPPVIHAAITRDTASAVRDLRSIETVRAKLGAESARVGDTYYYLGYGGCLAVRALPGGLAETSWVDGPKYDATELFMQKLIGVLLLPVGLYALLRTAAVFRRQASLTAEGLQVRGRRLIPLDSITAVRPGENAEIALIDYEQDGRSETLRLDAYVIKEQPAIVALICTYRGLPLPAIAPSALSATNDPSSTKGSATNGKP